MLRFSVLHFLPPPSANERIKNLPLSSQSAEKGEADRIVEDKNDKADIGEEKLPAALKNFYERHERIKSRAKKR